MASDLSHPSRSADARASAPRSTERACLLTCSYAPDAERCRTLCRSVARHLDDAIDHVLLVPRRDVERFRAIGGDRSRVVCVEDLLKGVLRRVPGSQKWWWSTRTWPMRGWLVQQLVKLSANEATDAEVLAFADSDVVFIRPVALDDLYEADRVRLYAHPDRGRGGRHANWNRVAGRLMGVEPRDHYGADFITQLVTWRRDVLLAMHERIEQQHGRRWQITLGRELDFSEYVLYGVFAREVLGDDQAGHASTDRELCHCSWHYHRYGDPGAMDVPAFLREVQPHHRAVLIQSNLGVDTSWYERLADGSWASELRASAGGEAA